MKGFHLRVSGDSKTNSNKINFDLINPRLITEFFFYPILVARGKIARENGFKGSIKARLSGRRAHSKQKTLPRVFRYEMRTWEYD